MEGRVRLDENDDSIARVWEMVQSAAREQHTDVWAFTSKSRMNAIIEAMALDLERDDVFTTMCSKQ